MTILVNQSTLSMRESRKYQLVWSDPKYRQWSPGEQLVDLAIELFEPYGRLLPSSPTDIVDFGCGSGRALKKFQDRGLTGIGVETALNAPDFGLCLCIVQACLFGSDWLPAGRFGFCIDVMEHIPTNQVSKVLRNIRTCIHGPVLFQIAHIPDSRNGEELHLTIKPNSWWTKELSELWTVIEQTYPDRPEWRSLFMAIPKQLARRAIHASTSG